jgi:hypothetical protein
MIYKIIVFTFVLLIVCLTGCNELNNINPLKSEEERFLGTWDTNSSYMGDVVFLTGGDWLIGNITGTWELKDGNLELKAEGLFGSATVVIEYKFENNDNTLILRNIDNDDVEYLSRKI